MKAIELFRTKDAYGAGSIEIVIWQVPQPVPPSEHPYKYRLVYVIDGKRIVGYDNERGKGDHKHLGDPFRQQLMVDFMTDVRGSRQ